jgi:hypothetical protein
VNEASSAHTAKSREDAWVSPHPCLKYHGTGLPQNYLPALNFEEARSILRKLTR